MTLGAAWVTSTAAVSAAVLPAVFDAVTRQASRVRSSAATGT